VVKKDGSIGWIGHPLMGLEEAIELALNNKLTPEAAAGNINVWERKA
jgi:hypothetical protein